MLPVHLGRAAGIIDGEGCITIIKAAPTNMTNGTINPTYRVLIRVTMGHEPTLIRLQMLFEVGTIRVHKRADSKVNASYSWDCQCQQAEAVLNLIHPHLVTKAKEADVALQFFALPKTPMGSCTGQKAALKTKLMEDKEALYEKLKRLKPRWRFTSAAQNSTAHKPHQRTPIRTTT